jgi:aryl-alcohol dehydrogenase-like predicted oxidoreductase
MMLSVVLDMCASEVGRSGGAGGRWASAGGADHGEGGEGDEGAGEEDAAVAEQHHKSPAQVMLRWHLQQGRSVIPKSTKPHRIAENGPPAALTVAADALSRAADDRARRTFFR